MTTNLIANGIHCGDALDLIKRVRPNSIDLIVTSPPYPGYPGGAHPDEFVSCWLPFSTEFLRVLRPTGSLVVNIREPVVDGERHPCLHSMIAAMRYQGWRHVEDYIWVKTTSFPSSYKNRLRNRWEDRFHFSKTGNFAIYQEQVVIPAGDWIHKRRSTNDLVRRTSAAGPGFDITHAEWTGKDTVYPSNVLQFSPETRNFGHPCPYPERLPEFFIKLFTKEGDVVLDPFFGTGTTAVAAKRQGRKFLGFEREKHFVNIALRRISDLKLDTV